MSHEGEKSKDTDPIFDALYLGCKQECRVFLELLEDQNERQSVKRCLQEILSLIKLSKLNQSDYKQNVEPVVNEEKGSNESNSLRYSIGSIISYAKRIHNIKMSWFQNYEKLLNTLAESKDFKKCTDLNGLVINICAKLKEEELLLILKKLDEVINSSNEITNKNRLPEMTNNQVNKSSNCIATCTEDNASVGSEKSLVQSSKDTVDSAGSTTCEESFSDSFVDKNENKKPFKFQNVNNNSNTKNQKLQRRKLPLRHSGGSELIKRFNNSSNNKNEDDDDISPFRQFSTLDPKVLDYYDYGSSTEVPKLDRLPTHMAYIRRYYTDTLPEENVYRFYHAKGTRYFVIDPEVLKRISKKEIKRNEENDFGSKYDGENIEKHLGEYDVYLSTQKSSASPTEVSTLAKKNVSTNAEIFDSSENDSTTYSQNQSSNASRKNYSSSSSYGSELDSFSGNESFWDLDFSENEKKEKSKLFGSDFTKRFDNPQKFIDTSGSESKSSISQSCLNKKPTPKINTKPNSKKIQNRSKIKDLVPKKKISKAKK